MHVQNTYLFNNYLKFSSTYHLKNEKEKGKRWRKKFARSGRVVSWLRRAPISKLFAPSPYASHCWGWRKEGNGRADNPSLTDPSTLRKPRVAIFLLSASPFSRHPRRWCLALPPSLPPSEQRRFLIRSRRFVHSAQRHVRRYSPLIFAIPSQAKETCEGGQRCLEFPLPRLFPRFIPRLFVHLRNPCLVDFTYVGHVPLLLEIVHLRKQTRYDHVLGNTFSRSRGFDFPFRSSDTLCVCI